MTHDRRSDCNGFAVVAALVLMGLFVLLLTMMATLAQMELRTRSAEREIALARQLAWNAVREAIAVLQTASGSDAVVTFRADLLSPEPEADIHPLWTGVLRADESTVRWLVSGRIDNARTDFETVIIVNASENGVVASDAVTVPLVPVNGTGSEDDIGRYAWWVGDESLKAPIRTGQHSVGGEGEDDSNYEHSSYVANQVRPEADPRGLWPHFDQSEATQNAEEWISRRQASLLPGVSTADARASFHHFSPFSRGLLTNAVSGGWRINLDTPEHADEIIDARVQEWLDAGRGLLTASAGYDAGRHYPLAPRIPRPSGRSGDADSQQTSMWAASVPCVVTELKLSIGFFHTHSSDRKHRLRYHMEFEGWNPYGIPIEMGVGDTGGYVNSGARGIILVWDGLPGYTVENLNTGAQYHFDMSAIDPDLASNSVANTMLHSWVEFRDGILLPGEVYYAEEPNPTRQPEGLQRRLSDTSWAWSSDGAPPANAEGGRWLAPDHVIRFTPDAAEAKVTVRMYAFDGPIASDQHPTEYGDPVLELRNIPFALRPFDLFGREYSRALSGQYTRADYRLGFYIRLRDDDEAMAALFSQRDPREPIWDFNDSQIRNLFEIGDDPLEVIMREDFFSSLDAVFFDGLSNSHQADGDAIFRDLRVFDVPAVRPISIGALRHMWRNNNASYAIGSPSSDGWNAVYDRYFFMGDRLREHPVQDGVNHEERINPRLRINPRISPAGGIPPVPGALGATHNVEITAPFNLLSTSVEAWEAILSGTLDGVVGPADGADLSIAAPFFRREFSAEYGEEILPDSRIEVEDRGAIDGNLASQGVRSLDIDEKVNRLAREIVLALQAEATARGRPPRSIQELLDAGVFADALEASGINSGIPSYYPTFITQADFIAGIAPFATVRGDTFTVRGYGETLNAVTGTLQARAWCEAIVQRLPEYIDMRDSAEASDDSLAVPVNTSLGRRYELVRFQWLLPSEI